MRYSYPEDREAFCRDPWPLQNSESISSKEAREEEIMLGLRLQEGIPLSILPASFNADRYAAFGAVKEGRFILNERGFYRSNTIIGELI